MRVLVQSKFMYRSKWWKKGDVISDPEPEIVKKWVKAGTAVVLKEKAKASKPVPEERK